MIDNRKSIQISANLIMTLISIVCIFPFAVLIMSSLTSETSLIRNGFSAFPQQLSLEAYRYLLKDSSTIVRAYGITFFVTLTGTSIGLFCTTLMAYALSIRDLPLRKFFSFFTVFTMLFNGGLVPSYIMWTNVFNIKNSLAALILPRLLVFAFYIIIMRTFFQSNIPCEIQEAARIDGASEAKILLRIVLPMSLPILATIGLMIGISYWNDWINGLYYITDPKLYSIQNILNRMLQDAQFIISNTTGIDSSGELVNLPSTGIKMSVASLGALPLVILFPFFQKYYVKGLTVGAVKG